MTAPSNHLNAVAVILWLAWSPTQRLAAQESPGPWHVRFELGSAEIHSSERDGAWLGGRVGRRLDGRGVVRLDGGITWSSADEGFATLELGLELRPLPRAVVTPVLGVGVGVLAEPEFTGEELRAFAGLDVRVGAQLTLRAAVQRAEHGGEEGPNVLFGGFQLGLGR
ncbi:MAG: hypothetical protein ACREMV_01040 [Gemmatimonadales bacterium]